MLEFALDITLHCKHFNTTIKLIAITSFPLFYKQIFLDKPFSLSR